MNIETVKIDDIFVPGGRRPLSDERVRTLAASMEKVGLLQPIAVHEEGGRIRLVAKHHRLAAAGSLGWSEIDAIFFAGDDVRIRLAEIAENLHRAELTRLERAELEAEWIRLTEADLKPSGVRTVFEPGPDAPVKPVQVAPVSARGGRGRTSGVNAASRELGIPKSTAHESVKIDSLAPEAKQAAIDVGLADNRSALLDAAKESGAAKQVEALKRRANKTAEKAAPKKTASKKPKTKTTAPALDSLAWSDADQEARRKFVSAVGLNSLFEAASLSEKQAMLNKHCPVPSTEVPARASQLNAAEDDLDIPDYLRRQKGEIK